MMKLSVAIIKLLYHDSRRIEDLMFTPNRSGNSFKHEVAQASQCSNSDSIPLVLKNSDSMHIVV